MYRPVYNTVAVRVVAVAEQMLSNIAAGQTQNEHTPKKQNRKKRLVNSHTRFVSSSLVSLSMVYELNLLSILNIFCT